MNPDTSNFIHLHVHSQYSLLDGAIRLDSLLEKAKTYGMDAVAMTDHGTMFGAVEFYEKALKAGIKPIIGCECYVAPRSLRDKTPEDSKGVSHLLLLAENQEGYQNLCRLASIAQLQGFYYKPRIDKEVLQKHRRGLICMSACLQGEIPQLIKKNRQDLADEAARFYENVFGEGNFFLEVQNNGIEVQETVNQALLDMSQRLSIPLVASNDCHYLNKEDTYAHGVLLCIQTGKTIQDSSRFKFNTDQLYFKSPDEMHAAFQHYPGALAHSVEIANRCQIEFDFKNYHFPQFDVETHLSPEELFEQKVRQGYAKRLEKIKANDGNIDENEYHKRLEYEIKTINEMGFPGYFLIVADFIQYAKDNGIPVGPGRGSAAGSIVAYSLGITDLDPIAYGLIFERFLNPGRQSMPDIDVDFCINGREKVFKYVVDRYGGGDYVAQIITFGKLKTRAVIRDVGRALDIPLREVDAIAKMVPDVLGIKLDEALEQEPKLAALAEEKKEVGDLIKICRVLEGLPRHASTHAAGVVIGDKPLVEYLPLYRGKKEEVVTQFDMQRVEQIGLIKFDFLGLRNLTVIDHTLKAIATGGGTPPDLLNLNLDDEATYQLLSSGDTTGVFQLESSGMKDLLVRLKPACFDDIIALVALYRPGPLDSGMADQYVERKHGREAVQYLVPELEPILKDTYGVIVYQEQVMKIAGDLANYTMADADGLRKAMGKKIQKLMEEHRVLFLKGAAANGIPDEKAREIFDLMEKFGRYGFNKAHSAAYALIAFQTAYLKTHFPVEFMAALLTSEMHSSDGVVKYINECRNHDITVLPPGINESGKVFTISGKNIRFGLVAVKNVGESAIDAIIEEREKGHFSSLFDFCERVDLRKVNKRVIESLIKCGALDSTGHHRAQMMAALEDAVDYGQQVQREKADRQMSLFDVLDTNPEAFMPPMPDVSEWEANDLLDLEKETLGFYISGHPLDRYHEIIEKFTNCNAVIITEKNVGEGVRIGGLIRENKVIRTKSNELMGFVTIEDMHGSLEVTVFSSLYNRVSDLLTEDTPVLLQGKVEKDDKSVKLIAGDVIRMEEAEEKWTANVCFYVDVNRSDRELLIKLREIVVRHPGSCRGFLHLQDAGKTETIISFPESIRIKAGQELVREVKGLLGANGIETQCSVIKFPDQNYRTKGKYRHA